MALAELLGVAFCYGFFNADRSGHGKMVIGVYGAARRVRLLPLASIALGGSLAQTTVAVALVYGLVLTLGWTRRRIKGVAQDVITPMSYSAVAGIGLWLIRRGVRGLVPKCETGDTG